MFVKGLYHLYSSINKRIRQENIENGRTVHSYEAKSTESN